MTMPAGGTDYVLITAARNEEAYVAGAIESVACQTIPPRRWVICLNSCSDRTEEIVRERLDSTPFISVLNIEGRRERSFANKVTAIARGFQEVDPLSFSLVGVLDADITFESRFYERLIVKFADNPRLGIAAGTHIECLRSGAKRILRQPRDLAVCGAQFFRRECFEEIGGYRPVNWGGEDTLAAVMAQMKGWQTITYDDIEYFHHREMGTEGLSTVLGKYRDGVRDQKLGVPVTYAALKFLKRLPERPAGIGALARLVGFCAAFFLPDDPGIPAECRAFLRKEKLGRLRGFCSRK